MGKFNLLHIVLITAGTLDITLGQGPSDTTVSQAPNRNPIWDTTSFARLISGISEATKIDDYLVTLKCDDPDGDEVLYERVSGEVVQVYVDGTVTLAQLLDFEAPDSLAYDVSFGCYDVDVFGFRIREDPEVYRLQISVDDANDNAPVFNTANREGYSFTIREDAPNGTELQPLIFISDADRSTNAVLDELYFNCDSPDPAVVAEQLETSLATCEKFTLEYLQLNEGEYSAQITLKDQLDFESRAVYSSQLVAIDLGNGVDRLSTTINIQINVGDAQDIDPVFTNLGATTSVSEGAQQGEILNFAISARDGDIGYRRPVKLSIIEDVKDAFYLSETIQLVEGDDYSATLVVNNSLDREAIDGAYYFTVKVVELNETSLEETTATATATYSVTITDINDETPEFVQSRYIINVTEMAFSPDSVQITGLNIVCEDKDQPVNAQFIVYIVNQTFPDVFSLTPNAEFTGTANIFVSVDRTAFADYDEPSYRIQILELEAMEINTANPKSSSTTVTIMLTDVNDNSPEFLRPEYTVEINENRTDVPRTVLTVSATDRDSGENGRVEYEADHGTDFTLNQETGEFILQKEVNYETTNQYVFLVYAKDHGVDSRSTQVQVTINVLNFNDLAPVFFQDSYQTSVNEGEIEFLAPLTVRAVDNEDGTTAVTYRIIDGQTPDVTFNLDPNSGSLTLLRALRYEDTVKDVNNRSTGRFELIVEASDDVVPYQTATVPVTIYVIDQNNHSPVLQPSVYFKNLSELAPPGTVVAEIKGTDDDEGDFGTITYRMDSGGYDNFAVDPVSGIVTVNDPQNFDYDLFGSYTVRIKATDGGSPQRTAFAIINVLMEDANNKAPEFEENIYIGRVDEESPVKTIILSVSATDKDPTQDLRYRIVADSVRARDAGGAELTLSSTYDYVNAIGINERNGSVFVNGSLDKDIALEIAFVVEVEDIAAAEETKPQKDTTQVSLTVTGKIDDDIIFNVIGENFMNENSRDEIILVATDPLNPQDNLLFYKDSGSAYFDVSLSGIVRANQEIDYETDPRIHRVGVKAVALDSLRSATATVIINILDVNDNEPVFDEDIYYASVDEDALYPTLVATIEATDADSSSYGPIVYRIGNSVSSSDFELFDPGFGIEVLVAKGRTLDYNRQSVYELDIIANDNPNREVSGDQNFKTVRLQIQVNDKNNNKPIFQFANESRSMAIAETAPVQRSIGTVIATDADFGENGEISYFLQATSDDPDSIQGIQIFRIIEELGTIVVAQSLIGLGDRQYPVTVRATDHGEPTQSAYLDIVISVLSTEINDGSPQWVVPSGDYHVYYSEEISSSAVINAGFFQVIPRVGDNITFALSSLSTYDGTFEIDSISGEIIVTRELDREIRETYTLVVYAIDTFNPDTPRSGQQIIVNVQDINDNDATFKNPNDYAACGLPIEDSVIVNIDENTAADEEVYQVSACDADGPAFNEIQYRPYIDENQCNQNISWTSFELRSDGRLITTHIIDHEERDEYTLCVEALSVIPSPQRTKRQADESLPGNVLVINIVVRDQNDNGPKFPEDHLTAVMNVRPNNLDTVVWLDAVDPDGDGFNTIQYSITSITFHEAGTQRRVDDLFLVKSRYAIAPSRTNYEGYINGYFEIKALATDVLNPQFQDTQTITVLLYRSTQAIKIIIDFPPDEGYSKAVPLENALNEVSDDDHLFIFLQASEHSSGDEVDATRTDLCFLAAQTNTNETLDRASLIRELQKDVYGEVLAQDEFKAVGRQACYPSESSDESVEWRRVWWVLVAIAIFIFVCTLIFIILVCILYRRYKRYMKSKQMYLVAQ